MARTDLYCKVARITARTPGSQLRSGNEGAERVEDPIALVPLQNPSEIELTSEPHHVHRATNIRAEVFKLPGAIFEVRLTTQNDIR